MDTRSSWARPSVLSAMTSLVNKMDAFYKSYANDKNEMAFRNLQGMLRAWVDLVYATEMPKNAILRLNEIESTCTERIKEIGNDQLGLGAAIDPHFVNDFVDLMQQFGQLAKACDTEIKRKSGLYEYEKERSVETDVETDTVLLDDEEVVNKGEDDLDVIINTAPNSGNSSGQEELGLLYADNREKGQKKPTNPFGAIPVVTASNTGKNRQRKTDKIKKIKRDLDTASSSTSSEGHEGDKVDKNKPVADVIVNLGDGTEEFLGIDFTKQYKTKEEIEAALSVCNVQMTTRASTLSQEEQDQWLLLEMLLQEQLESLDVETKENLLQKINSFNPASTQSRVSNMSMFRCIRRTTERQPATLALGAGLSLVGLGMLLFSLYDQLLNNLHPHYGRDIDKFIHADETGLDNRLLPMATFFLFGLSLIAAATARASTCSPSPCSTSKPENDEEVQRSGYRMLGK